jgi:alpha-D-ribose 1-methylphosphonate 5-triphosphate diphosphatase PhnM
MADRGRLLRGLRADVVLVKGNPAADIGCAMDIVGVWRGGIRLQQVVEL